MLTKAEVREAIQATTSDEVTFREDCLDKAWKYLADCEYTLDNILEKDDNSCLALFVYDVICHATEV